MADENFTLKEELKNTQNELVDLKVLLQKNEKEKKRNVLEMEQIVLSVKNLKAELEQKEEQIESFFNLKTKEMMDRNQEKRESFKKVFFF